MVKEIAKYMITKELTCPEIIKVLDVLIGKTEATGDSSDDHKIYENVDTLASVTYWCLDKLWDASTTKDYEQGSMSDIGHLAFSSLVHLKHWVNNTLEEE